LPEIAADGGSKIYPALPEHVPELRCPPNCWGDANTAPQLAQR
jgi:hypothetical protein